MKGKLRLVGRVVVALVLALSLGLVTATPVSAGAVGTPTLVLSSYLAADTDVQHTISFDIGASLSIGNTITIDFNDAYGSPATVADDDVTLDGAGILGSAVAINTGPDVWVITLAAPISTATNPVVVVITSAANLDNPVAGTYTLSVETTAEDTPTNSSSYMILERPDVTAVQPDKGNAGETMWVEVTGTAFTGNTTACTTSFAFGTGVSVVSGSYHWIDANSVDCQITIASDATAGARSVTATSTAGADATPLASALTVGAAGTAQVDVWETYTPVTDLAADTWDLHTLAMDGDNVHTTITLGVAAATTDDVIRVHAATYNEQVAIPGSKSGLTLVGNSRTDTIIQAPTGIITTINIASPTVTIREFWIKVPLGSAQQAAISLGAGAASSDGNEGVIEDNKIDSEGVRSSGAFARIVLLEATDYWEIKDNEFVGDRSSIAFNGADNILVSGNSISGGGVGSTDNSASVNITGNQFIDAGIGIATSATDLTIEYNTISGANSGIKIWGTADIATVHVRYNNISGNINYGIEGSTGSAILDAKYNYWGGLGGPGGDGLGNGDNVTGLVVYEPWLTKVQATAITDGIAYHGSTLPLEAGWNTLSVPLALDDAADTLSDIVALGDFLVISGASQNYDGGFYYDAVNSLWMPIVMSTYEFQPGAAVYVKMLADASFPVLYSGVFNVPSVSLPAGWNLGGSAFGIDKVAGSSGISLGDYGVCSLDPTGTQTYGEDENDATDADDESWKAVNAALASLGANASVVISPSMPGQEAVWAITALADEEMIVGEGYWVFMTSSATLAGFEVTPIYKIFPTAP